MGYLLECLDLCRQLSDSTLVFNSGFSDPSTDHRFHTLISWQFFTQDHLSPTSDTCNLVLSLRDEKVYNARYLGSTHEFRYHVE